MIYDLHYYEFASFICISVFHYHIITFSHYHIITFSHLHYSLLKLFTGLATAAFIACDATVAMAINIATHPTAKNTVH